MKNEIQAKINQIIRMQQVRNNLSDGLEKIKTITRVKKMGHSLDKDLSEIQAVVGQWYYDLQVEIDEKYQELIK